MLKISAFLLVSTSLSHVVGQYYTSGDECFNDGGKCVPLQDCPSKMSAMRRGIRSKICQFDGMQPFVCCHDYRYQPALRPPMRDFDYDEPVTRRPFTSNTKKPVAGLLDFVSNRNDYADSNAVENRGHQNDFSLRNPGPTSNGQKGNDDYSLRVSNPIDDSREVNASDNNYRTSVWQNEVTNRPRTSKPHRTRVTQGPLTKRDQFDGTFMRISEQKCREYSSHVTEDYAAIPLLPDPEPVIFSVPKCQYDGVPLIVGGEKAELGEFPHMAAVGYKKRERGYSFSCGGTLISERFVLTAAHCTSNTLDNTLASPIPQIVRLGDLNLVRDDDGAEPINVRIAGIIAHPQYKPPAKYHDIALLKLQRDIAFSVNLRPACLWTKTSIEVKNAVATGWGQIDFAEEQSDDLLKVVVDIIDQDKCRPLYAKSLPKRKLPLGITNDQFCAGSEEGGRDTCGGDSGGPLQVNDARNKCILRIIGVTSFGIGCGTEHTAGVYTRVSRYASWIEGIVWPRG